MLLVWSNNSINGTSKMHWILGQLIKREIHSVSREILASSTIISWHPRHWFAHLKRIDFSFNSFFSHFAIVIANYFFTWNVMKGIWTNEEIVPLSDQFHTNDTSIHFQSLCSLDLCFKSRCHFDHQPKFQFPSEFNQNSTETWVESKLSTYFNFRLNGKLWNFSRNLHLGKSKIHDCFFCLGSPGSLHPKVFHPSPITHLSGIGLSYISGCITVSNYGIQRFGFFCFFFGKKDRHKVQDYRRRTEKLYHCRRFRTKIESML